MNNSTSLPSREETAATVLDAWGQAIRGDWGSIDGRSSRAQLAEVSAYLRGARPDLTLHDVDVCDGGDHSPHWLGEGYECEACKEAF